MGMGGRWGQRWAWAAALCALGCDDEAFEGRETVIPVDQAEVLRIFDTECVSCHAGLEAAAGLDLSSDLCGRLLDGQLVLADDAATAAVVEVNELQNFNQAGAETTLALTGSFEESRVTYLVSAEALFPLVDSVGSDAGRSVIESTNVEFATQLGFALTDWASLNYQLLALRVPALVEDWQVTNSLLLTMGGNWTKRVVTRTYDLPGIGDDATVPVPDAPVPDAPVPDAAPAEEAAPTDETAP